MRIPMRMASTGRAVDPAARRKRLEAAFAEARARHADHVIVSGDLTEYGTPAEFEEFADVALASGIAPENVTIIPGNHDRYQTEHSFRDALNGPLAPFAKNAPGAPGKMVDLGDAVLFPLDVTKYQNVIDSSGLVREADADAIAKRLADPAIAQKASVLVIHHPPFRHRVAAWHMINGLHRQDRVIDLMERSDTTHLVHGHLHRMMSSAVGSVERARAFGVAAVVNEHGPRVRLFEVDGGVLWPSEI
ncbi:hypothetical protein BH09MYX1_BH09MYX1_43950 [soil metagenome]